MNGTRRWWMGGLLGLAVACGGGGGDGFLVLYVSDVGPDTVSIYRPVIDVDGDVAPTASVGGFANSILANPWALAYDPRGDTLLVGAVESDSIKFFDNVRDLDGDVAPTRVLAGPSTLIADGNGFEIAVDTRRDLLYLAVKQGVHVYANARTIDGDVAPVARITGASTGFSTTRDKRLVIDSRNDRLYVLDSGSPALFVFDDASTRDGDIAPDRKVFGGNTMFNFPWGMALDVGRDILYVSDESDEHIVVFDNASTIDGNVAPSRMVSGVATMLGSPTDFDVDPETDTLYMTNSSPAGVLIWEGASTIDGEVAPTRAITGAATGFASPKDLAVAR